MKKVSSFSPLFLAIAATMATAAQADDSSSTDGFIEGSHLNLDLRNYYYNHDNHDVKGSAGKLEAEWAQGFSARFESGFTQGTVGFGLDVDARYGLKLDGGGGTSGSSILPESPTDKVGNRYGDAPTSFGSIGGTLKVRAFDTVLRIGDLYLDNPVVAGGTTRLLPMTFQGVSLTNNSIKNLTLEGGQASFTTLYNQSGNQRIQSYYDANGTDSKKITWAGGTWKPLPGLATKLYGAQLKDMWDQYFYSLDYTYALNDLVSFNPGLNYYRTNNSGQSLLGSIDNNTFSLHFNVAVGMNTFGLSLQKVNGNTPFDYIRDGDSINLDNSQEWSDFNGPGEKSWKALYGYDFTNVGVPGLTSAISYTRGTLDLTKANADSPAYGYYYTPDGKDAMHWERDLDVKYVVQHGPVKDLSVRLRWATNRGTGGYNENVDHNQDEYRVIVDYPVNIF
ncbi:OprD family porin [Pseudomonas sp. HR96]|uniref:OprD family porin n=1 Tax=Pseudomonas sp. HR96 TaxID=1027966 RepID=UPI002A75F485|nr:OprD family porin [Pseudomonas sp. HR96]WPP00788.1 OprD family porin [Pseudomonas sp. HR96]